MATWLFYLSKMQITNAKFLEKLWESLARSSCSSSFIQKANEWSQWSNNSFLFVTSTFYMYWNLRVKSSNSTSQSSIFNFQTLQNYRQLMEVWDGCLEKNLETEVQWRIISCGAHMMSFKFFYGINVSFKIYSITDNLLKALPAEAILAVESQKTAKLSLETTERM